MTDNIIQFPNKDEYVEEDKGEVMARITIYENGMVGCWLSDDIDSPESATWLKACIIDGVFGMHQIIHIDPDNKDVIEKELDDDD